MDMKNTEKTMDQIVALCKGRGFVYPGSEIYGGLANSWDYGPLGVELKNNVKRAWWKKFVQENPYNVGLDAAILMNPEVWVASGHVSTFNDPLIDCKACKMRHRADKLIEGWCAENGRDDVNVEAMTNEELVAFIRDNGVICPGCGKADFTDIRKFNLMFKTHQGVTEDSSTEVYLRPETAQGIFVNFPAIQRTTRKKLPFGVCQVGKSFRNEITPGNFIFRIREFEQMELEFFCQPGTDLEWFQYWREFCRKWLVDLGLKEENLRLRDHEPEELAFYSKATTDFEFMFPFGWGELWGVADRTDYDLKQHQEHSGKDLTYFDQEKNEHYIPYVIEPSLGADRVTLAFLVDAYDEEIVGQDKKGNNDVRTVLRLHPALAPFKCAVLPLSKKEVLSGPAQQLRDELARDFMVDYDDTGSIGKRYRRQDEIGTPFCITLDFQTVGDDTTPADHCVTIRERDSMEQVRIPMSEVKNYIAERIKF
jgi:glycyl-tRNA synthetase